MEDIREIDNTLGERYIELLSHINNIWKLEKEKFKWRIDWHNVKEEISTAGSAGFFDELGLRAAVLSNKEKLNFIEKSMSKIKEKQIEELDKIKSIIEA